MLFCVWSAAAMAPARATDYRIESEVFVNERPEAVSRNVTLFRAGLVYDYLSQPESVTIFDARSGRFVLIDPAARVQTEIATDDVAAFNDELKLRAAAHKDPLLRFMADPQFKVTSPQPNLLVLSAPNMTYRIKTIRGKDAAALRQYIEFSDWYARLNTLVNVGSPPPFTRIAINQTLARQGAIPTDVEVTIVPAVKNARAAKMRSHHEIGWKLLGEDLRRIDETGKQLATFKKVSFDEFHGAVEPDRKKLADRPGAVKKL
jgi:hypothetical protein